MPNISKRSDRGNWRISFPDNKVSICNAIKKILGFSASAQPTIRQLLHLIRNDQVIKLIRDYHFALSNLSTLDIDVQVTLVNGEIKWFKITGMPFQRQWGKVDQMIGTIQDISQRVTEESFGLSVINHELRNPLTIVMLNTQLVIKMLSKLEDNPALPLLKNAETHLNGMTSLMEEYLTNPIKNKAEVRLNQSVFDLNKIIDTLLTEMCLMHRNHHFVKLDKKPCIIKADKYKVIQVFINYLTNAVTHSPEGSQIIVSVKIQSSDVEVCVRDNGSGIPKGCEEMIFEKHYRGETKATSRHNKGLGLYLVKNIIQNHGGAVRAKRNDDRGSAFFFTLPLLSV